MKATRKVTNGTASLADKLAQLGYTPGVPDGASQDTFKAVGIDAACAASMECPECGYTGGMAYLPLWAGPRYAGVAVCPKCHTQLEV